MPNPAEAKRILEAVLLASQEPLGVAELKQLFDDELSAETLRHLLAELREEWNGRGVELVSLASGWRVQTRAEIRPYVQRPFPDKPPPYSPAPLVTPPPHPLPPAVPPRDTQGIPLAIASRPILPTL